MDSNRWYEKQFRIIDILAPEGEDFLKIDIKGLSKTNKDLIFNAQHIEIIDLMDGGSDTAYFNSPNVKMRSDLLKPIVSENKKNGIRNIIYVNVHWSGNDLIEKHRDWMQMDVENAIIPSSYGTGSYFCVNTGFTDWTRNIIKDIAAYEIDGIFLDGPFFTYKACFCNACKLKFKNKYGYEMDENVFKIQEKMIDFMNFKQESIAEFVRACRDVLKSIKPDAIIYMNGIEFNANKFCSRNNNLTIKYQDFLGAEGGFLYYNLKEISVLKPGMTAKLIETQADGKPTVVFIAGRWSPWVRTLLTPPESWIVHAEAVANGANTWYGIHAENNQDETMKEIQAINKFLKRNEKYCSGTHSLADIALLWSGKTANFYRASAAKTDFTGEQSEDSDKYMSDVTSDFIGWYEMLSRNHEIFDVIDDYALENKSIEKYKTVILPNISCMSAEEASKVREYVRAGGNVISTYDTSMFDELGKELAEPQLMDVFGIQSIDGKDELPQDHIKIESNEFTKGIMQSFIPATGFYQKVIPYTGSETYLTYREKQPSVYSNIMPATRYPFIIVNSYGKGKSIYFSGNLGDGYNKYQIPEFKKIAGNALRLLAVPKIEIPDEIDSIDISYRSNGKEDILHIINYTGAMTRPIEKVITLKDVKIRMYDKKVKRVYDTKRDIYLAINEYTDYMEVVLPELKEYEIYALLK
jgi:Beta-galactosidase